MARGSYGLDDSTGQGAYVNRTSGGAADVSADPIDQPSDRFGSDESLDNDDMDVDAEARS